MARTLPRSVINEYTRGINELSEGMRSELAAKLEMVDFNDIATARSQVLELMRIYCTGATDAAAVLAARFYDLAREYLLGATDYTALVMSGREDLPTDIAVSAILKQSKTVEQIITGLTGRLDFEVKRAAGDCIFENGRRDPRKPKYARVPSGAETCPFCLMLASRGFVYTTKLAAGDLNHYHANCDCRIVPSWGKGSVEDYDPTEYHDKWQDAINTQAKERAEKNGTTEDAELKKINEQYRRAANKAKGRRALDQTD